MLFAEEFDPLTAKGSTGSEVAIKALKREITNILDSYVGWFDPFSELIQNALDSVDERADESVTDYIPKVNIIIDIKNNTLTVSDNGMGLNKEKYTQFLAPSFSFKSGKKMRGHKGVGATYIAYGFNDVKISTKANGFSAKGKMIGARKWLNDENPSSNPKVVPNSEDNLDIDFNDFDQGVSISITFDRNTKPGDLSWIKANNAEQWKYILSLKTAIGSFFCKRNINVKLTVIGGDGNITTEEFNVLEYLFMHNHVQKAKDYRFVKNVLDQRSEKQKNENITPSIIRNLDAIYDRLNKDELIGLLIKIKEYDSNNSEIIEKYIPEIYFCYMYSTKIWQSFNTKVAIRTGNDLFVPGIQIATNNMPQGEIIQVPLNRNIGRQNQIQIVFHFENCRGDLGRKGFQKEIVDFAKNISKLLIDKYISIYIKYLRPASGNSDILRQQEIEDWKREMIKHEEKFPLEIKSEMFFLPTKKISISSFPTREQDVISLFNQLLAGGVIRGINLMSTNERFTYDGMYKIFVSKKESIHSYHNLNNPLGMEDEKIIEYCKDQTEFHSTPRILEYKFSLDGLIEDMESGVKNSNDINLIIVWETGSDYKENYSITSLLDPNNLSDRDYHGITHVIHNSNTHQKEMDMIVLSELIDYLNDCDIAIQKQREKYDE